ncbi:MAG: hypothetical protein MnENMB40S_07850 [Rhizobiaceae bacterium MnEN-MB40S]|nr:MAG: hypothetical protein MnENMB40S_07850 [Rhizobiaceae bacterium MnEN-MB40S]
MKRVLAIVVIVLLAGGLWWGWSSWNRAGQVLVSGAKASLVEGETDTVHIYLTIENKGRPDRIVSASSSDADEVVLYNPESEAGIPLPSEGTASFAADGAHVVLKGVHGDLSDGRLFPVEVDFERAGPVTTKARLGGTPSAGEADHVGLFGVGDICRVGEGEPAPKISLDVTHLDDGKGWKIDLVSDEFRFDKSLVDGPHVPGTGHAHLYVGGLKIKRLYEPSATIGELPPGEHTVRVTLNTNDHRAYVVDDKPVTAQAVIRVD